MNHALASSTDDNNRIILRPLEGHPDCKRDFINACYIDVCYIYPCVSFFSIDIPVFPIIGLQIQKQIRRHSR